MPQEKFKLPISSYNELVKIIRGYTTFNREAAPRELTASTGMHETGISGNTGFLASIGVLTEGRKKMLTEQGRKLANALNYEIDEQIFREWQKVVLGNEFLQKMISAVRIRNGMDSGTLRAHIAYSAGQPKKGYIMVGAGAIIEILKVSGFLEEEDGNLTPALDYDRQAEEKGGTLEEEKIASRDLFAHPTKTLPSHLEKQYPDINISIQIQIRCDATEIGELGTKVQKLIKDINKISLPNNDKSENAHSK